MGAITFCITSLMKKQGEIKQNNQLFGGYYYARSQFTSIQDNLHCHAQTLSKRLNVEVTGAARLYRAASVWTAGLCLA